MDDKQIIKYVTDAGDQEKDPKKVAARKALERKNAEARNKKIDMDEKMSIFQLDELFEAIKPLNFGRRLTFLKYCKYLVENRQIEQSSVDIYTSKEFLYEDNIKEYNEKIVELKEKLENTENVEEIEKLKKEIEKLNIKHEEEIEKLNIKYEEEFERKIYRIAEQVKNYRSVEQRKIYRLVEQRKIYSPVGQRKIYRLVDQHSRVKKISTSITNITTNIVIIYATYKFIKSFF